MEIANNHLEVTNQRWHICLRKLKSESIRVSVKKTESKNKKIMFLFLLFHMVGKSHGPGGFLFQLIDSWTCSGCEHETSAGGEHPLLSAHLSRGAFTVCSCKEIDVHFFSTFHSQFQLPSLTISLSVGLIRSRYCSLQCVWGSAASSAVTSTLGGPLFYSVETSTC